MISYFAVVVMILTVSDCDTGKLLFEHKRDMDEFSISGDRMEDCRKKGVEWAKTLTAQYRQAGYENASTNVNCYWKRLPGQPA